MLEKVAAIVSRYEELNRLLADPEVISDPARLRELAQEQSSISEIVEVYHRYEEIVRDLESTEQLLAEPLDEEMAELAREEAETLRNKRDETLEQMKKLLLPKDPRDERNVIVEIRAGAGGEDGTFPEAGTASQANNSPPTSHSKAHFHQPRAFIVCCLLNLCGVSA